MRKKTYKTNASFFIKAKLVVVGLWGLVTDRPLRKILLLAKIVGAILTILWTKRWSEIVDIMGKHR